MVKSLSYYLDRYARGQLTSDERVELIALLREPAHQEELKQLLDNDWDFWEKLGLDLPGSYAKVKEGVLKQIETPGLNKLPPTVHRVHFIKTAWFRYAAAVIVLFGIGAYLWNNYKTTPPANTMTITPSSHDIAPGGQKATLTLADGRTIILDSINNGQLAVENGSKVVKQGGEIIYDGGQVRGNAITYNTMSTPKGGQYQLILADGTKVWLNAASSITYPTVFTNKTREVSITGEVYFEVKANKDKPFIVKTSTEDITVLGTAFNVNAYKDEPAMKVSLLEGLVKVGDVNIKPGQAYQKGQVTGTDLSQDIAWKNGYFNFNGANAASVMRQISRWYDVDVVYKGAVPKDKFHGKLSRDLTLSQILEILKDVNIHFEIEGKTLHVN